MCDYFNGKTVRYNISSLKEQLNSQNIYFDSYEFDDPLHLLNIIDEYNLNIIDLDISVIEKSASNFYLRGSCVSDAAIEANDEIVDMLRVIKLNLQLNDYHTELEDYMPNGLSEMLEYINKNIILIQYPVKEDNSEFHSFYLDYEDFAKPVIFINTNEYLDNQYFYLAHELYHHFYKDNDEVKADKFAAKLLIPDWLLSKFNLSTALTDIADIQKITKTSYKSIVKALYNRGYISYTDYEQLMSVNPRSESYCKLVGEFFNTKNNIFGVSEFLKDVLMDNYLDGKISKGKYLKYRYILYGQE